MKNNRLKGIETLVENKHQKAVLAGKIAGIARTILKNSTKLHEVNDMEARLMSLYGENRDFGFSYPIWTGTSIIGPAMIPVDNYVSGEGIHSDDPVWRKLHQLKTYGLRFFDKTRKARSKAYSMQLKMRNRTMTECEYNYILTNSPRRIRRYLAEAYDTER